MATNTSLVGSGKRGWNADEEAIDEEETNSIERRLKRFKKNSIEKNNNLNEDQQDKDKEGEKQDEEGDEEEIFPALADIIDLTDDTTDDLLLDSLKTRLPARNGSVSPALRREECEINGISIKVDSTVEITEQPHLFRASFLWVKSIIDSTGEGKDSGIQLRGIPLTRLRNLRGRLPRLRNEVAMILHVDADDKRDEEVQACIEVSATTDAVIRGRICHFTNADFPQHRVEPPNYTTNNNNNNKGAVAEFEQNGPLMCRWRCIFVYRDAAARTDHLYPPAGGKRKAAPQEYILEHLSTKHVSKKRFKVSETVRFNVWRGAKVRGGDYVPENDSNNKKNATSTTTTSAMTNTATTTNTGYNGGLIVPLDGTGEEESELVMIEKKPGQRYTFGDMFCGAGGASLGARKAGFHVKIGCDHHAGACHTHRKVFPECDLDGRDIFQFIADASKSRIRVDVLHLSPPCQFWSPAHTVEGVNDEANIEVLFSCRELIKKLRPRVFTLEQTFGILHPKFEYYFNALIHGFTENGYSVRWKSVNLVDWGAPATRKRLIMIGSCPGEELPTFPEPTHAPPSIYSKKRSIRRGKKPYITVQRMLARIPRDASNYDDMHQPAEMRRKRLPRWDPDVTLARCITTNGGYGNYHPNGRRDFTMREYATLQTFPVDYPFHNSDRKKQIGNAFPPLVVKALYTHIRKWLERQDRVYAVENEPLDLDDPDVEVFDVDADISPISTGVGDVDGDDDSAVQYMGSRACSGTGGTGGGRQKKSYSSLIISPDPCYSSDDRDSFGIAGSGGESELGSDRYQGDNNMDKYMDIDMDMNTGEYNNYGPVPCIDANQNQNHNQHRGQAQRRRRRVGPMIDLTESQGDGVCSVVGGGGNNGDEEQHVDLMEN